VQWWEPHTCGIETWEFKGLPSQPIPRTTIKLPLELASEIPKLRRDGKFVKKA
jgi:hypothetical protein